METDNRVDILSSLSIRARIAAGILLVAASFVLSTVYNLDTRITLVIPGILIFALFLRNPSLIIYLLTAFALMRLDAWMSSATGLPFGKIMGLVSLLAVVVAVTLAGSKANRPTWPVMIWSAFVLMSLAFGSIEGSGDGVKLWLADMGYASIYFLVIFLLTDSFHRLEKLIFLMMMVGLVTSMVNVAEFLNPAGMAMSHSSGRAAGLLKNANTSAFIVNLSLIASVYALRTVRRRSLVTIVILLQVVFFFGVFTTFSREGILLFTLIFTSQFALIRQRGRRAAVVLLAGAILLAGMIRAVDYIRSGAMEDVQYSFGKITSLVEGNLDDNDRIDLLDLHLERFSVRPLTGHGLYSALSYSLPQEGLSESPVPNGPHNTFVMILSETGFVPLLLYLVMIVSLALNVGRVPGARQNGRETAMRHCLMMLLGAWLVHHFFSHMMLLSRFPMVMLALLSLPRGVYRVEPGGRGQVDAGLDAIRPIEAS